jgi:hypothetical protein
MSSPPGGGLRFPEVGAERCARGIVSIYWPIWTVCSGTGCRLRLRWVAVGAAGESVRRCDALRGRSVGVVCREIGRSVWCFVRLACRRGVAWRWIGVAWRGAVALDEAARSVAWCCAAARSVPCLEIGHSNDRSQGKGPMSVVVPVQETDLISVAGARDRCRWSRWCDGPISPVRPMQRTDVGGGARARDRRRQRGWCKGPMSVVGGSAGGRSRRCHRATDRSRQCR